jgi:hypothetical protein
MKNSLSYIGYGLWWYISWLIICLILLMVKFFLIGDFLVLAILGLFSIILSIILNAVFDLIKYLRNKQI